MQTSYRPELDVSMELTPVLVSYYMSLIGIIGWIVELGVVDICLEVSMMSSHMAMPIQGHLDQVLNIFGHLKKYHNSEMVFDPSDPVIDETKFEKQDWTAWVKNHLSVMVFIMMTKYMNHLV